MNEFLPRNIFDINERILNSMSHIFSQKSWEWGLMFSKIVIHLLLLYQKLSHWFYLFSTMVILFTLWRLVWEKLFSFSIYISYSHFHLPNCYLVSNLLKKIEIIEFNHTHLHHVMSDADTCRTSNKCQKSNALRYEVSVLNDFSYIYLKTLKIMQWFCNYKVTSCTPPTQNLFACISWYLDIEYLVPISY